MKKDILTDTMLVKEENQLDRSITGRGQFFTKTLMGQNKYRRKL